MNTHGYITDTPVYDRFWTFSNPHFQRYIALTQGHMPSMHNDFTYVEVGCGNAMALCTNAAANPEARFIGIDFTPEYIDEGWKYVDMLGLTNVELMKVDITKAFGIPAADFIFAHGFLSWVAPDIRTALFEFLGLTLKPGGLAFASYDSMPGSSHRQSIHHIAQSYRDSYADATDRMKATYNFLNFLYQNKSHFTLQNNAIVKDLSSGLNRPETTAHLYGNEWYRPLWFVDVNREMNSQGLVYCGSTTAANNNPSLVIPEDALKAVTFPDIETLEFVKDMFSNMEFRSDLFIRPQEIALTAPDVALKKMRFMLTCPRELAICESHVRVGVVKLHEGMAGEVFDKLETGAALYELDDQMLHNLVGISLAIAPEINTPITITREQNRAFIEYQLEHNAGGFVTAVSGVLGSGAIMSYEAALLLFCGSHGAAKKWVDAHPDAKVNLEKLKTAVPQRAGYQTLMDRLTPELF
jgi:trans-aconitate methyltransferase